MIYAVKHDYMAKTITVTLVGGEETAYSDAESYLAAYPDRAEDAVVFSLVDQPPSIPQSVTRAQFKLALLEIGLLGAVEAAVAAGDDALKINWFDRLEFERPHPLIAQLAAALGKTDADIDNVFILAATK